MEVCVFEDTLAWKQSGEWMSVPDYVAHHRICSLPCNVLTSLLKEMKLRGYSTLNHRLKAELLLKHLGWSQDAIEAALSDLKIRTRKKKVDTEGGDELQEDGEEKNDEED